MSDGMGREFVYLSSQATNRYFSRIGVVFTLRVCSVVFSSVYPCNISETAMKLAVD